MHMLYNSDHYVVVRFDVTTEATPPPGGAPTPARGGYEIVDKFARKEIFIEGALAESFKLGVQALVDQLPGNAASDQNGHQNGQDQPPANAEALQRATQEALDEYIGRFTILAQQPVMLH